MRRIPCRTRCAPRPSWIEWYRAARERRLMPASDSASSRRSDLGSDGERSFGPSSTSGDGWTTRGFTILDPEKGFRGPSMKGVSPHHRSSGLDRRITQMGSGAYQISADVGRRPLDRRREGETALGRRLRSFRCAPWKTVRIFEGIVEVFQDAHFSKRGAHLQRMCAPSNEANERADRRRVAPHCLFVPLCSHRSSLLLCDIRSHCLGRRRRSVDCANDADLNLIGDICVICG